MNADQSEIDELARRFFAAFDNTGGKSPDLGSLRDLFVTDALICKNVGGKPECYDVDAFIAPRRVLLTDGSLVEFREWEVRSRTDVIGAAPHRDAGR